MSVNYTAGDVLNLSETSKIEFVSGNFTFDNNEIAAPAGSTLAFVGKTGNYSLRNENTFISDAVYTFTTTALITKGDLMHSKYTISDNTNSRTLNLEMRGTVINNFNQRGFTLTKGSSETLKFGKYSIVATALDDAAMNIALGEKGLSLVPNQGDGKLNIALNKNDKTILAGELECTSGSITIGFDNVVTFKKDTAFNFTYDNYSIEAVTSDDAYVDITFNDTGMDFTPHFDDGALNIVIYRDKTPIFNNSLNISGGTISFNSDNQTFSYSEGTKIVLSLADDNNTQLSMQVVGGPANVKVDTISDGTFSFTPQAGDGSLNVTIGNAVSYLSANIEMLNGSFILGKKGALTVTKDSELKFDFGNGYVVNFKVTNEAGGSILLGTDGITFTPGSNDGGLELSVTRDGETRTASLDVTGSVTYKLDGSISLTKGTVVKNVFADGNILTITANTDASGSMIFTPQNGLTIKPSTPDALNVVLTTSNLDIVNISSIDGTINYTGGIITASDGTKTHISYYFGWESELRTTGGSSSVQFTDDRTIYTAGEGATFAVDYLDGTTTEIQNGSYADVYGENIEDYVELVSEGTTLRSNDETVVFTLATAGNYNLNGMDITTTEDNAKVTLTDYDTVSFAAGAPAKISTTEGGKLFFVEESEGKIQCSTKNSKNATVSGGSITYDPVTKKFSCTSGTNVALTRDGEIITFTMPKEISASYKVENKIYYYDLDNNAMANLSVTDGEKTIFTNEIEMSGVVSYRPETGTFGLTGANSSHGNGSNTSAKFRLKDYDVTLTTNDTTIVFIPKITDGKLEMNFPNERKQAMLFTLSQDGKTNFSADLAINGTLGFDADNEELSLTKGTVLKATLKNKNVVEITALDDASKLNIVDGGLKFSPNDGGGTLNITLGSASDSASANLEVLSGGFILRKNGVLSVAESTELKINNDKEFSLTLEEIGNYTINGLNFTTTAKNSKIQIKNQNTIKYEGANTITIGEDTISGTSMTIRTADDGAIIVGGLGDFDLNDTTVTLNSMTSLKSGDDGFEIYTAAQEVAEEAENSGKHLVYINDSTENVVNFNNDGNNVAIIGNNASNKQILIAGSGGDSLMNYSKDAEVSMIGGSGDDYILATSGPNEYIDLSAGGKDTIAAFNSDRLTVHNYDAKTGAAFLIDTDEDIAELIAKSDTFDFGYGKSAFYIEKFGRVVLSDTDTVNGTFANFINNNGEGGLYGWVGVEAIRNLDASSYETDAILFGKTLYQNTIRGGAGNDSIYAGGEDIVYLSGGEDIITIELIKDYPSDVTINLVDVGGSATVKQFHQSDVVSISDFDSFAYNDTANGLQLSMGSTELFLEGISDSINVLIDDKKYILHTAEKLLETESGRLVDFDEDLSNIGNGYTYTSGEQTINHYNSDETITINREINNIEINSAGDVEVNFGTGNKLKITDVENQIIKANVNGQEWTAKFGSNLTYDDSVNLYGYNSETKLTVSDDYSGEEVAIFANGLDGKIYNNVKEISANEYSGQANLIGNDMDNIITGSKGDSSLWGGTGGSNDTLIGSDDGYDEFFYLKGNGNDIINKCSGNDVINLLDISLDDISEVRMNFFGMSAKFKDGGSLKVNTMCEINCNLGDGSRWKTQSNNFLNRTWAAN